MSWMARACGERVEKKEWVWIELVNGQMLLDRLAHGATPK
jgi:hypothetical protein